MNKIEKSLKEQLESVIDENQKLLEKHFQQDSKIVKLIEENNYYKIQLQQKENIIKEVREYVENNKQYAELENYGKNGEYYIDEIGLLEILDKGSDSNVKD